jgi:hypothetical protein
MVGGQLRVLAAVKAAKPGQDWGVMAGAHRGIRKSWPELATASGMREGKKEAATGALGFRRSSAARRREVVEVRVSMDLEEVEGGIAGAGWGEEATGERRRIVEESVCGRSGSRVCSSGF